MGLDQKIVSWGCATGSPCHTCLSSLSLSLQLVLHIYTYECMYVCTRFTDRKKFYGQYNIIIIKLYAQVVSGLRSRVPLDCAKEHNDRKKK